MDQNSNDGFSAIRQISHAHLASEEANPVRIAEIWGALAGSRKGNMFGNTRATRGERVVILFVRGFKANLTAHK